MYTTLVKYLSPLALLLACFAPVAQAAPLDIQILSATIRDQKIEGASLILQKNGEQSVTAVTNARGEATLNPAFDASDSLLIVKKPGYSDLVVKCPCDGMTYAISPVMQNLDGMRIVLNWGRYPEDLDSHLLFPGNHVYFSNMRGRDALLDVDDTTSYGPETITIERKHDGSRYVYAVHNFSDRARMNSNRLSESNAKVFVYVGQTLIKTYYVPRNQVGNLWTVFAVTESGDIEDFNTLKNVSSLERLSTSEFGNVVGTLVSRRTDYGADRLQRAKGLNRQGEQAYHAGQYDEAIRLYRAAIDEDANYGQAYSNLGLAFQKANRVAEALWANRKAIALASGASAPTVRASSHYNNGRIYEKAGQWSDALREYRYARDQKANAVYDRAIERMLQNGAR